MLYTDIGQLISSSLTFFCLSLIAVSHSSLPISYRCIYHLYVYLSSLYLSFTGLCLSLIAVSIIYLSICHRCIYHLSVYLSSLYLTVLCLSQIAVSHRYLPTVSLIAVSHSSLSISNRCISQLSAYRISYRCISHFFCLSLISLISIFLISLSLIFFPFLCTVLTVTVYVSPICRLQLMTNVTLFLY